MWTNKKAIVKINISKRKIFIPKFMFVWQFSDKKKGVLEMKFPFLSEISFNVFENFVFQCDFL